MHDSHICRVHSYTACIGSSAHHKGADLILQFVDSWHQPDLEATSSNAAADRRWTTYGVGQVQNHVQTVSGISYSWSQSYGLRKVPEGFIGPALGEVHVSQVGPR